MHCAPTTGGFLSGCHRPSIMARRSSPLLLALGDGSPDSVNSPMILASSALACWSWKTMLSTNHSGHHRDLHLVTVNLASLVKPVSDYWLFILKPVIGISKIQSPMVRGCLSIVKDSHSCERLGECRLYKKCAFFSVFRVQEVSKQVLTTLRAVPDPTLVLIHDYHKQEALVGAP